MKQTLVVASLLLSTSCQSPKQPCSFIKPIKEKEAIGAFLNSYNAKVEQVVCDTFGNENTSLEDISTFRRKLVQIQEENSPRFKELGISGFDGGKTLAELGIFENTLEIDKHEKDRSIEGEKVIVFEQGEEVPDIHNHQYHSVFEKKYPAIVKKWYRPAERISKYHSTPYTQTLSFSTGEVRIKHLGNPSTYNNPKTGKSTIIFRGFDQYYYGNVPQEHEMGHSLSFGYTTNAEENFFYIQGIQDEHIRHFDRVEFGELLADFYAFNALRLYHPESLLELLFKPYILGNESFSEQKLTQLIAGHHAYVERLGQDIPYPYLHNSKYIARLISAEAHLQKKSEEEVERELFEACFVGEKEYGFLTEMSKRQLPLMDEFIREFADILESARVHSRR